MREEPRLIPTRRAGEFDLMGGKGGRYCIEATTNLENWVCVGQLTTTQAIVPFMDTNAHAFLQRFYRAFRQ